MAEDLNQLLIKSGKYEDYVKMAEASLLASKSDQSWAKFCLDFPIFLLTIHQSDYLEFYQIPQKEHSAEASMATLADVHLV